jgi:hypothetical protein
MKTSHKGPLVMATALVPTAVLTVALLWTLWSREVNSTPGRETSASPSGTVGSLSGGDFRPQWSAH